MRQLVLILSLVLLALPAQARQDDRGTVLAHPAGCPRIAFCGCGVSVKLYGRPIRELFRAAAYLAFPITEPTAGAVAVYGRHHVAFIEAIVPGGAILYDPNSGGHLTRRHFASLAGARIVRPTWTASNNVSKPSYRRATYSLTLSASNRAGRLSSPTTTEPWSAQETVLNSH